MFVLDTNVLSELMRPEPAPAVAWWMGGTPDEQLFTTAICQAEILSGIAFLPTGRRRVRLEMEARALFETDFVERVLSFDNAAAEAYANVSSARRSVGRLVVTADLFIAAIARAHGAMVLTRDVGGFEHTGVALLNPWDQT